MHHSTQRSRTPDATATLPPIDAAFSQQIADPRREIEGIQELNIIYRSQKRKVRLEEIVRQLAVLRNK